ncbi:hypothetical protein IC619_001160 [Hazenella sp. IB182353]|uniref:hypothetical protein n=1 Tax=Polycladospora coralii TaxID=2771432 RepID=UPI0017464AD3|nr:hypothetical protein [Polycladospora coralii]MBS7529101.1 hypothetical protein [Polycladospora coralii]
MNRLTRFLFLLLCLGLLTACYPDQKRQQLDQLPQHVMRVQSALETYEKQRNILPFQYRENETMLTTHYLVDFKEIGPILGEIPPSAFENGGYFYYVIVNTGEKPTVRLLDLRIQDRVKKIEPYVKTQLEKKGKLPSIDQITNHIFSIDYEKLGTKEVWVESPYTPGEKLPLVMDQSGNVYVDYRNEVMRKMQESKKPPQADQDLREWLALEDLFAPSYSPPMKIVNQEPVFVELEE